MTTKGTGGGKGGTAGGKDPLDALLASKAAEREGERVPADPAMLSWAGRGAFVLASIIYALRDVIRPWAAGYAQGPPTRAPGDPLTHLDGVLAVPAQVFHWLLSPAAGFGYFEWGVFLAWLILLGELVNGAYALVTRGPPLRFNPKEATIFRIRPPGPFAVEPGGSVTPDASELYRALHGVLSGTGGLNTKVTLLLFGRPDRPTRLSTAVMGNPKQQSWFDVLRSILRRQEDGVIVDQNPNLLSEVMEAHRAPVHLAFCELGPRLGPEYPLRQDEGEGDSLMSLLVTASQPRGEVLGVEYQLILHPRNPQLERLAPWRVRGERRLKKMRRRDMFQISADTRMLEEKIRQPSLFATTVRVVAVATTAPAARMALDPLIAALQQFTTQSGRGEVQRLVPRHRGVVAIKDPSALGQASGGLPSLVGLLLSLAGLAVGAGGVLLLHQAVWIGYGLAVLGPGLALWGIPRVRGSGARMALLRTPRPDPPQRIFNPLLLWRSPALLSAGELAGLWGLPPKHLASSVEWLPCRIIPAPPAVMPPTVVPAPKAAQEKQGKEKSGKEKSGKEKQGTQEADPEPSVPERPRPHWITVGEAWRTDGSTVPVGTSLNEFRKVCHVTAGMGAGKSRLAANLCRQFIELETGFVLIDGKGDDVGGLTRTVRQLIPRDQEHRVVLIDLLDAQWMVGLNPLMGVDLHTPGAVDRVLGQVRSIFERLDPATWGKAPGMQQFLDMAALLVLYGQDQPNLAHVSQAIVDEAYRVRLLPKCTNTEVRQFWEVRFPELGDTQKSSMHALMRRFDQLLVPELTRFITTSPTSFDLVRAMEEQRIILVPVPHITLGGLAASVAMLVFQAVIRAAFQRAGSDQSRLDYPLIIDELQVIAAHGAAQDMELALSQLRAQGIPAFYLHQALIQIGEMKDLMMNNAMNRFILRAQEPDASVYANQYPGSGLSPADISGQDPVEHQYVILSTKEGPQGPFSIRPLGWPTPVDADAREGEDRGPLADWRLARPDGAEPDQALLDELLLRFLGSDRTPDQTIQVIGWLAALPDDEWAAIIGRWAAIRQTQRAYLLAYPACIPDRLKRQQWLSRLENSDGSLLMAVSYKRSRPAVAVPPPKAAGKGAKGAKEAKGAISKGGSVQPEALVQPVGASAKALSNQRGSRRSRGELGQGYEETLTGDGG
jgi:hypothetical protein